MWALGADAFIYLFIFTVYYSPYLGCEPSVQRLFRFYIKTVKNKRRSSESS